MVLLALVEGKEKIGGRRTGVYCAANFSGIRSGGWGKKINEPERQIN